MKFDLPIQSITREGDWDRVTASGDVQIHHLSGGRGRFDVSIVASRGTWSTSDTFTVEVTGAPPEARP